MTDLTITGRGFSYAFDRSYRSADYWGELALDDFGTDWTYSYADDRLLKDGPGPIDTSNYIRFTAGQTALAFVNRGPGRWDASSQQFTQLHLNTDTGDLEMRESDGMVYSYFPPGDARAGRLKELRDRNENHMTFDYEPIDPDGMPNSGDEKTVLAFVIDTIGREIRYQYYARTSQSVSRRTLTTEHPLGNVAAWGRLAPNDPFFGFATLYRVGDVDANGNVVAANANGVPAGGTILYTYTDLNPTRVTSAALTTPALQVGVLDRDGNDARYVFSGTKKLMDYLEFTRGVRPGEPTAYRTVSDLSRDHLLRGEVSPAGNSVADEFNNSASTVSSRAI